MAKAMSSTFSLSSYPVRVLHVLLIIFLFLNLTEKHLCDPVSRMQFMVCYEFWDSHCMRVAQLFMSRSRLWEEAACNERTRGGACWCWIISQLSYIRHQSVVWFTQRPDCLRITGWSSAWAYHGANEDHTPRAVVFINLFALVYLFARFL